MSIDFKYRGCSYEDSVSWNAGSLFPAIDRLLRHAGYSNLPKDTFCYRYDAEIEQMKKARDPLRYLLLWNQSKCDRFKPEVCVKLANRIEQIIASFGQKTIPKQTDPLYEEGVAYVRWTEMINLLRKAAKARRSVTGC